jgi:hypothetical protein
MVTAWSGGVLGQLVSSKEEIAGRLRTRTLANAFLLLGLEITAEAQAACLPGMLDACFILSAR